MNNTHFTVTWLPVWSSLPQVQTMTAPAKPAKTTSSEVLDADTVLSPEQVREVLREAMGLGHGPATDLFAQMTLDPQIVEALPTDWIYAYYLNARYGRPMPESMMPVRIRHIYNANDHLLSPLMVCSAILMRLWDKSKSTIDPSIKYENDCLMRCIVQLNYVLYQIVSQNPTGQKPAVLLVSSVQAFDSKSNETNFYFWFDHDRLQQWEAQGHTAEEAMTWWQTHHTQPS